MSNSGTATKSERQKDHVQPEDYDDDTTAQQHCCFVCGKTRSGYYHHQHPPKVGRDAIPSLCRGCRGDRKSRLIERGRDGKRRRRVTRLQAHVDNRHWCANCGVLRSEHYHQAYKSSNLPPWSEICRKCKTSAEQYGKHHQYRLYIENLEAKSRIARKQHELLRDNHTRHQTRRSVRKPDPALDDNESASSTLCIPIRTLYLADSNYGEQPIIRSAKREESPDLPNSSKKGSKDPCIQSSTRKATVETDPSDGNNGKPAKPKCHESKNPSLPHQQEDQNEKSQKHDSDIQLAAAPTDTIHKRRNRGRRENKPKSATFQSEQQRKSCDDNEHEYKPECKPQTQPQIKRMGISDMYWASEEGMFEQFLLSPTFIIPGFQPGIYDCDVNIKNNNDTNYDFGYGYTTAYHNNPHHDQQQQQQQQGGDACTTSDMTNNNNNSFPTMSGGGDDGTTKKEKNDIADTQIWEVDSDEAEEIDKAHAGLVTGRVKVGV